MHLAQSYNMIDSITNEGTSGHKFKLLLLLKELGYKSKS